MDENLPKTSAKQRRKDFNPRKWAKKWLRTNPMKTEQINHGPSIWKEKTTSCSICKNVTGIVYRKNHSWYCSCCIEQVNGKIIEERSNRYDL